MADLLSKSRDTAVHESKQTSGLSADVDGNSPQTQPSDADSESAPSSSHNTNADTEKAASGTPVAWEDDLRNALNFSTSQKTIMMVMVSLAAFTTTAGSSIISPAAEVLAVKFDVSETASYLPLSLYVFALAFGPVLGGPLSESVGRMPVYYTLFPLGAIFTLGAGFSNNFGALCFLRFLAGFCWAPTLTVAVGSIAESFAPARRGPMLAIFILMPFLGPGLAPVMGAFATNRQNWRWTQWILEFFALVTMVLIFFTKETFPQNIKRRIAKENGEAVPPKPPVIKVIQAFLQISLIRPVHMLFTEPILVFVCLYHSVNFGVLFSFFAAIPYTMATVYGFGIEQSGLVFLAVFIGCLFGMVTITVCDGICYKPQISRYAGGKVPPEYRLYSAMVGSIGLPLGLFWFAWTAKSGISWASPVVAIIPFSWGNLCVFVSTAQYITDTYKGSVVASASGASTLTRYSFSGIFPLFIIQMFKGMGVGWALSLFGFVTVALLPIPWVFFKFGPSIRAKSKYETN